MNKREGEMVEEAEKNEDYLRETIVCGYLI